MYITAFHLLNSHVVDGAGVSGLRTEPLGTRRLHEVLLFKK